MQSQRKQRLIWVLALAIQAGIILSVGIGAANVSAAQTSSAMSMAGMAPAQGRSEAGTVTVVALHQRVVKIGILNFAFHPARIRVSPGTRVIWTNHDSDPHTVDGVKNLWASEALDTDGQFSRVFSKVGTFTYFCSIHPFMHGTIIVTR